MNNGAPTIVRGPNPAKLVAAVSWIALLLCWVGCGTKEHSTGNQTPDSTQAPGENAYCGEAALLDVRSNEGKSVGVFELQNDKGFLWVTFAPSTGLRLHSLSLFVGDVKDCPKRGNGLQDPSAYPIQATSLDQSQPWEARVPLEELGACIFAAAEITVARGQDEFVAVLGSGSSKGTAYGLDYCIQTCGGNTIQCNLDNPAQLPKTIPQTAWKEPAFEGLKKKFEEAFPVLYPDGLTLGCNRKIAFSSPQSILGNLPMQGAPVAIDHEEIIDVQPGNIDNHLVGELLTLDITIKMDARFADFSTGEIPLPNLEIAKGAFEGWTLAELLQEGNVVLGACTSNYTPAQIDEVLHGVNASFEAGKKTGDYLRCPQK